MGGICWEDAEGENVGDLLRIYEDLECGEQGGSRAVVPAEVIAFVSAIGEFEEAAATSEVSIVAIYDFNIYNFSCVNRSNPLTQL